MSKTKEYNPFSNELMDLIEGVYSENYEFANRSFELLINYFNMGLATDREIDFLIIDNNNYVVKLLSDLKKESEAYELLRSTVDKVVAEALSIDDDEDYIDIAGEIFQFDEEL